MSTKHTFIALLVVASFAVAAPALAQVSRLDQLRTLSRHTAVAARRQVQAQAQAQAQAQRLRERRRGGPEQTERFAKTFKVGDAGSLYVNNISGDITVKVGSGGDIVVDATKRTPQGSDAQRQLSAVTIETTQQGNRLDVRTRYPEQARNIRTSVDYIITVPAGTSIDVHNVSGNVQISGVKGALRSECISGDMYIENAAQIEQVKGVSGDITVVGGSGTDVRVSNYSGDLTLRNVKARSLDVNTISGEARLTDITADHAAVKTLSGGVEYTGPLAHGGRYEFTAHSGDVKVVPTSNTGFEIDARTFSGDVRCDLPITLKQGEAAGHRGARHEVSGTYGDGSALVTVHTFNGDVIIGKNVILRK